MSFWLAVILLGSVLLFGMLSILWVLARGSNAKRRWTLVGLLLNREMNVPEVNMKKSFLEQHQEKRLQRQKRLSSSQSHAYHSQHHSGGHYSGSHYSGSHHSGSHHSGGHHSGGHSGGGYSGGGYSGGGHSGGGHH